MNSNKYLCCTFLFLSFALSHLASAATISGITWEEIIVNGAFDGSEIAFPNATVTLEEDTGGGVFVAAMTTTSDSMGAYEFTNVSAGTYQLRSDDIGFGPGIIGPLTVLGDEGESLTANIPLGYTGKCPPVDTFANAHGLVLNPGVTTISTNIVGSGALGGERDVTFTATQAPGTSPGFIPAFNFADTNLWEIASPVNIISSSCISWDGPDGDANTIDFTGLGGADFTAGPSSFLPNTAFRYTITTVDEPVTFTIRAYTDASNWSEVVRMIPRDGTGEVVVAFSSFAPQAGTGADFTNIGAYEVCVETDQDALDFALSTPLEKIPTIAAIGNRVWLDQDANGQQDPGELGIGGVTVNLYSTANPGVVITNMMTDPLGQYFFTNLAPGDYFVEFVPPANGVLTVQDAAGVPDTDDSDADPTTGQTIVTTLGPGEEDPTWDAGIYFPAEVGDTVWFDTDRDGVLDPGEMGIPNVAVELFQIINGAPVSQGTMMTDANGNYFFRDLQPGDYFVEITPPTGFQISPQDNNGADDTMDSDIDPVTGQTVTFTLASGDSDPTRDAGLFRLIPGFTITKEQTSPMRVAEVGETITFEVVITNTGQVPFVTVPLTDTYNASFIQFDTASPAQSSATPGTIQWTDLGSLAVGASHTVTLNFTALQSTSASEMLNVASTSPTTPPGEDTVAPGSDDAPYEIAAPDYEITKTRTSPATPDVEIGGMVTFDITIDNTGEVLLQTVPLTDTYDPTLLQFVSATPANPDSTTPAGTLSWANIGAIAPGASSTVTVNFMALASTAGALEVNVAETTPSTPNQELPTMEDEDVYRVLQPDYSIVKDRTTDLVAEVGETVSFTITVSNTGEVDLETVPVTDTYDATFLSFLSATPPVSSSSPGMLTWDDIGGIVVGANNSITLNFRALASTGGAEELNTAATTPTTATQTLDTMTDDAPYIVLEPDYTISKDRTSSQTAEIGQTISFDIAIDNIGEVTLATVPLTDTYDASLIEYISASVPPTSTAAGNLQWINLGPLAPGANHTVTVNFRALASTGGNLEINTAATAPITDGGTALDPMDDDDDYRVIAPEYTITKTRTNNQTAEVGGTFTFDIVIENTGEVLLSTVPLTDVYDATLIEFVTATPAPTTPTAGNLAWADLGSLAPGASHTVSLTFEALASTSGNLELNTASTTPVTEGGAVLPTLDDDDDYRVVAPSYTITKTRTTSLVEEIDGQVTFDIVIENTGEVRLNPVPVTDTFDNTVLQFLSATPTSPDNVAGSTIMWSNIGAIDPDASRTLTVTFEAIASTGGNDTINVASTMPSTPAGPLPPMEDDDVVQVVEPSATLVKNRLSPVDLPAEIGETVTFEIIVGNDGEVDFTAVPLTDTFDDSILSFQSASVPETAVAGGTITWADLGFLAVGESHRVTVSFTAIASTMGAMLDNTAATNPETAEGPIGPLEDTAPYAVGSPMYTITKDRIDPIGPEVNLGGTVTFRITVENTGEIDLLTVPLVDTFLAASLEFDSSDMPPDSVTPGTLTWNDLGPLPVGDSHVVDVTFTTLQGTDAMLETNVVSTTPTTEEGPLPTMSDDAPYLVQVPSFLLTKELTDPASGEARIGDTVVFTIEITNDGEVNLTGIPLSDTYDTDFLSFISATPLAPSTTAPGMLTWDNVGPLAPGEVRSIMVAFEAIDITEETINIAAASATDGVTELPEQMDMAPVEVGAMPMIALEKTVLPGHNGGAGCPGAVNGVNDLVVGVDGDPITYCFRVTNNGDVHLTDINLVDTTLGLADISAFTLLSGTTPLAPGQSLIYFVEDTLEEDLVNTATVTGTPSTDDGTPLAGAAPLTDSDTAEVQEQFVSLGDYIWFDTNADGVQDADEDGIEGLTVNLLDANEMVIDSTTTGPDGEYTFDNLPPGTYGVQVVLDGTPYMVSPQNSTVDDEDSDADPDGLVTPVPITVPGSRNPTLDVGLFEPASLGDYVWEDLDSDGTQGTNEPGVEAVTVSLYQPAASGIDIIDTTMTDSNGFYTFEGLIPGMYGVIFSTLPPGFGFTSPNTGTNDTIDSDADGAGAVPPTDLAAAERDPTLDAGIIRSMPGISLEKTVLAGHSNGGGCAGAVNGVNDLVVGVEGDEITYCFRVTNDGDVHLTDINLVDPALSLADISAFTFLSGSLPLAPGQSLIYYVEDILEDSLMNTATVTGTPSTPDGTPLDGVAPLTDSDDAEVQERFVSLGDYIWLDANANGAQDGDEDGIEGLTVNLLDGNGTVIGTTTTGPDGEYTFDNLPPGNYGVAVILDGTPYVVTVANSVADDRDSDAGADGVIAPVGITEPGTRNPTLDIGLFEPASLGDTVWNDINRNGTLDPGESGVEGVTVELYEPLPDGTQQPTGIITTTDANGMYSFTGLAPGMYGVIFSDLPEDFIFTDQDLGDDASDSDADPTTGVVPPTMLSSGENDPTLDAGIYQPPARLGDTVWLDLDGDGIPGENLLTLGLSNVVVNLFQVDENGVTNLVATMNTGPQGFYEFTELPPGEYIVAVDASTLSEDIEMPKATTVQEYTVVLMSGDNSPTNDFGFIPMPTAIDLAEFSATATGAGVSIQWATASESSTLGFNIYGIDADGNAVAVNESIILGGVGSYALEDTVGYASYILEELETDLTVSQYGPFDTVESFIAAAGALVYDVTDPEAPVLLEGTALNTPGAPPAVLYTVPVNTPITVAE